MFSDDQKYLSDSDLINQLDDRLKQNASSASYYLRQIDTLKLINEHLSNEIKMLKLEIEQRRAR